MLSSQNEGILSNPTEFGKVVLEDKKSEHCVQDEDLEGY